MNALRKKLDKSMDDMAEGLRPADSMQEAPKTLKVGDEVEIVHLGVKGTVLSAPDQKGEVQLQAGIMKTKANISQLRLLNNAPKEKKKSHVTANTNAMTRSISLSCDVRGMNLEEALVEVERYLDQAVMSGMHEVTIVHGKGTGILRSGIHQDLRHYRHVDSWRLGVYGEGEDGVTVVTLKQ